MTASAAAGTKRKRPVGSGGTTKLAISTAIAGALALGLLEISIVPFGSSYRRDGIGRRLASVDQHYDYDSVGGCEIKRIANPPHSVQPTCAASYPGSGAKLSWNLISALSGLPTTDDRRINGLDWHKVVSVKTHYPTRRTVDVASIDKVHFPRALLILRHPKDAIPSYHNHLYEKQNGIAEHSTRAPLDAWVQWRDANFYLQMEEWTRHTEYWLDAYQNGGLEGDRLVITYESITDDVYGPAHANALARFLDKSEGVDTVELDEGKVACVWRRIIKYKDITAEEAQGAGSKITTERRLRTRLRNLGGKLHRRSSRRRKDKEARVVDPSSHRDGDSFRPYTDEQLDFMAEKLEYLRTKYIKRSDDIVTVLESYLDVTRLFRAVNGSGRTDPTKIFHTLIN